MSVLDNGGTAFPAHSTLNLDTFGPTPGMSLRDFIATNVLTALVQKAPLLDRDGEHGPKFDEHTLAVFRLDMARSAYDYADAMLRTKRHDEQVASSVDPSGTKRSA